MLGSNTLEHLLLKLINNNKFDPNILNSFIKKLLFKNISVNPNNRLSLKKTSQLFNELTTELKAEELKTLNLMC